MAAIAPASNSSVAISPAGPSAPSHALSSQTFRRLHPSAYLDRFLAEGYRPDGRKVVDGQAAWRSISVNTGSISTSHGSSLVRLGESTIVCGISAETFTPSLYTPNQGMVVPNVDLPALCSPKFKPGPPGEEAMRLTERLDRVLQAPFFLPLDSLCISPSKSAWVLYIDAVCINYDGNVWDAILLAVIAALRNTRIPIARYDDENDRTVCKRDTIPLALGPSLPISTTFGVYNFKTLLPDPTSFEEPLLSSTITLVLSLPTTSSSSSSSDVAKKPKILLLEQTGLGGLIVGGKGVPTGEVLKGVVARGGERAKGLLDALASS